jgi:voltage-gated potassium channel Kch
VRTWRLDVELNDVRPIETRLQSFFDVTTMLAAILTLPVVLGIALDPSEDLNRGLEILNWCCWAVFALELVGMLAVSRDRRAWLRSRPITPVIVVLTLPAFAGLDVFRMVRLLRGRVARRVADGVTSAEGLRNVALVTLLTVGLGGFAFAKIEPGVDAGDGLYWAVTTVTTTGYGDIVPTTETGKSLAMVLMLVGAAFLAVLTGAIAQRFVGRWQGDAARDPGASPTATMAPTVARAAPAGDDAVLAKLDELGQRLAALERAVTGPPRGR